VTESEKDSQLLALKLLQQSLQLNQNYYIFTEAKYVPVTVAKRQPV